MMKCICKIFREIVDRDHKHHAAEVAALTSRLIALKLFPGHAAVTAGDLGQAAALLRAERKRQDWSLPEFLEVVGMSRATLNRIENRKYPASIATLERLAAALGKKLVVALVEIEHQDEKTPRDEQTISES